MCKHTHSHNHPHSHTCTRIHTVIQIHIWNRNKHFIKYYSWKIHWDFLFHSMLLCHSVKKKQTDCVPPPYLLPPNPHVRPGPHGDDIWRWSLGKVMRSWGWSPHEWISAFIAEAWESSFTPSSRCRRHPLHLRRWLYTWRWSSQGTDSASTFISDVQTPELWGITAVVYKLPSQWYFCFNSLNRLRHCLNCCCTSFLLLTFWHWEMFKYV